jgi:putative autoinducer-2 (AI-2) aldolase
MALSVFVGAPHQHQSIANLGRLVDEGERYGIPVVAVTAVGKSKGRDARDLSHASRICAEMGIFFAVRGQTPPPAEISARS